MKSSFFKKTIWTLFYLLIFVFLIFNSYNYLDADLGWHLKVGEDIAREMSVPSYEKYNYTLEGKTWVDHEWLLDFLSFEIYDNFGYFALTLFFATIVILTLLLITNFTKNYYLKKDSKPYYLNNKEIFLIMFFQLFGTMAMAPHLGVRMQEITLLFIIILLTFLMDYNLKKNYKILFFLFPLFYIWSCAHAGFLIGLCIAFFFVGIKFTQKLFSKFSIFNNFVFSETLEYKNILTLFIFSLFSLLSTFFTPYGLKLYSFLSEYSNTFYMKLIAEWLPAYYMPIQYKQLLYLAIFATLFLLFIIDAYFKYKKNNKIQINLWLLSISVLFFCLSFKSKRHFPLFFVVSFPFIIILAKNFIKYPPDFFKYLKNSKIVKFYLVCGFILASLGLVIKTNFTNNPFQKNQYCASFPCEAINFIQNKPELNNFNIFNSYDWGGYMTWVNPDRKIFIDGRLPQYKFAGHTLLEEYLEFFKKEKVEEKLNQYNISLILYKKQADVELGWIEKYILMVKEKEESKKRSDFNDYLENNSDWDIIFEDEISKVYLKK